MGVVSKRFDRGGLDGIPVDTETKGNAMSIFFPQCGHRFLKTGNILLGMKFFSLE